MTLMWNDAPPASRRPRTDSSVETESQADPSAPKEKAPEAPSPAVAHTPAVSQNNSDAKPPLDARFVSQSVPLSVAAGRPMDVAVTFQNTGQTPWTAEGQFGVGAQGPRDNSTWGVGRIKLSAGEVVAPGEHYTFQFTVRPPASAGQYAFQWQMVQEHVQWFGEASQRITIRVTGRSKLTARMETLCSRWEQRADQVFARWSVPPAGSQPREVTPTPAAPSVRRSELSDKIDAIFSAWDRPDSPGCAMAFIQEGEIIYQRGYGSAQIETGAPITPATVFHGASLSKQFLAFVILRLAEQEKLTLDDDIRRHVPELPDFGVTITLRRLLHHTSGLRDVWQIITPVTWRTDYLRLADESLDFRVNPGTYNPVPDEQFLYCNTGYFLLEAVARRVSGKSLQYLASEWIFEPLGMTSTRFCTDPLAVIPNRASAYEAHPTADGLRAFPLSYTPPAESALFTTVEDLARWDQNFYTLKVGSEALFRQLVTPGMLSHGRKAEYALGLAIRTHKGVETQEHGGHEQGCRSFFIRFPERKFSIVVLSNMGSITPNQLALQVADVVLSSLKPRVRQARSNNPGTESARSSTAS